ncbi:MAG: DUF968 domain-containing protein [Sphingobium sp.]|nr:DUF968 domain-containing protein [Sphingobium sp.]
MLPRRIPKAPKRASRWRSQAHCSFVRSHACCNCHSMAAIEVAHVRIGSGAGVGQKPDDWRTVSLCRDCHATQHRNGERSFWAAYKVATGQDVETLIEEFITASPKRLEIRQERAAQ